MSQQYDTISFELFDAQKAGEPWTKRYGSSAVWTVKILVNGKELDALLVFIEDAINNVKNTDPAKVYGHLIAMGLLHQLTQSAVKHKEYGGFINRCADGIANACLVRYGTNILEGCNNVAKVIKRTAFGFRDFEYYALKLKAAFPGRKHKSRPDAWELVWAGSRTPMGLPVTFTN